MLIALIGLILIFMAAFFNSYLAVLCAFGLIGFDLVNEVVALKNQLCFNKKKEDAE